MLATVCVYVRACMLRPHPNGCLVPSYTCDSCMPLQSGFLTIAGNRVCTHTCSLAMTRALGDTK